MNDRERFEDNPTDYFKGQYLLLSAICESQSPKSKFARVLNLQALQMFRVVVKSGTPTSRPPRSPRSQELLETLVYISVAMNILLGGGEKKGGEPTELLQVGLKEWLKEKSIIELGQQAIMVHYALIVELGGNPVAKLEAGLSIPAIHIDECPSDTSDPVPAIKSGSRVRFAQHTMTDKDMLRPPRSRWIKELPKVPFIATQQPKRRAPSASRSEAHSPPKRHRNDSPEIQNDINPRSTRPTPQKTDSGVMLWMEDSELETKEQQKDTDTKKHEDAVIDDTTTFLGGMGLDYSR